VLSWRCRRFRARFSPGAPGAGEAHRRRCAACAAYAAALELAAVRLPLPERLRGELRALPADLSPVRLPVPSLPLPPALRGRLQGIAREEARRRPPAWIESPRYAVAASLLLAVLSAALVGNPAAWGAELGARAAGFVGREVAPPLAAMTAAGETGRERLRALRAAATSRCTEIAGQLGASAQALETRVSQIAGRLLPAPPHENVPDDRPRRIQ
jgi:hypothetical protein